MLLLKLIKPPDDKIAEDNEKFSRKLLFIVKKQKENINKRRRYDVLNIIIDFLFKKKLLFCFFKISKKNNKYVSIV